MALSNQQKLDRIERGENVWHAQIPIGAKDKVSAEMRLYWVDKIANQNRTTLSRIEANQKNLITAIARVSGGEDFDEAKLLAGITATNKASNDELIASVNAVLASVESALTQFPEEVRAAVMSSLKSITTTTTTTAEVKDQP